MTGARAFLAVRLRADRWALTAWVLGTLLAFAGTAAGVAGLYTTDAQRQSYEDAIAGNPGVADKIRGGKVAAAGALVGAVMKATRGQADATRVKELILEKLGVSEG